MFRFLMKIGGALALAACSNQAARLPREGDARGELVDRVQASPELAVLFTGNSYSFGVPRAFSKLAAARGKPVRVGHAVTSGWTLARHAASEATLRKIRTGGWDIVVLQEHSEIPAMPARKRATAMDPALRQLVRKIRGAGAIPVLYQTWGRRDGDRHVRGDDFHAMSARLRVGYQAASRHAGGLLVIPVGDAWEREITAGRGGELYLEDGSHPSEVGNRVTAGEFYKAFFVK